MSRTIASFACGLIFGFGLLISGMTDPVKVLGFLDVFRNWDPTLAIVMAGALVVVASPFWAAATRQSLARHSTGPAAAQSTDR